MALPVIAAAALAVIIRQAVMSVVTGAGVTAGLAVMDGTAKQLVYEIRDKEGVTEATAKEIVGDLFLDLAVNSASIMFMLRTGAGVKVAEFLGLTSKGFAKKPLSKAAQVVASKLAADGGKKVASSAIPKILSVAAIPGSYIWLASALANIIEPGIYKPEQTNALYQKLGIPFQYPTQQGALKPGPFTTSSSVTFSDYAKSIETQPIVGIKNPILGVTEAYTRENLAGIIDYVYGKNVLAGKALSVKELLPKISPYLVILGGAKTSIPSPTAPAQSTPSVKVYTGIVSQGVVGKGLVFTSRPDDLIESIGELRTAAANNLAPYLASLLGKIVYEIKVVASIITKDGFKQTGTAQKIQTGTWSNGTPKYKTVVNKFAIMVLYALTDKGSRAKLTTVVLGPVDSAKLQVGQNDLRELELALPALVTTTDVEEIKEVKKKDRTVVIEEAPVKTEEAVTPGNIYWDILSPRDGKFAVGPFASAGAAQEAEDNIQQQYKRFGQKVGGTVIKEDTAPYPIWKGIDEQGRTISASASDTLKSATAASPITAKAGSDALTLYEWYQAQGQAMPSVEERSKTYEGLGLGPATYFTGTAEQNTKLLNALKSS